MAGGGDAIVVPPGVDFQIANDGDTVLRLLCCLPVGGQAVTADGRFTPPWANDQAVTIPLARLLAVGYAQLIEGLHERLAAAGWDDVRPTYGFVLLSLRDRESSVSDLAALLGVSKQATSKLLDQMAAGEYVTRATSTDDARQRTVALAPRGRRAAGRRRGDLRRARVGVGRGRRRERGRAAARHADPGRARDQRGQVPAGAPGP